MACSPTCKVPVKFAQYIYFLGFLASAITCWVLRDYGGSALDFSPLNKCIDPSTPENTSCLGQQAVMRISLGTFLFFSLHLVVLLGVTTASNPRLVIHTGFWPIKFLLWGGMIGACFAMPNSALDGFGQAARVFAGIFIVLQLIILLEFFYAVNEWLLERDGCAWALVAGSALFIAGSFVGIGFMYNFYSPSSSCSLNIWFITSAMLFFFGYAAVSVSPLRHPSAGLFTSAAVFAYCTYYTWSALNSEPTGAECSASSVGANKAIQIVGFVIAILALGVSTMNSGISSQAFDLEKGSGGGGDGDELPYRPDFFHAMHGLAACYMLLLFVGWELSGSEGDFNIDQGWGSTWVKMAASWLCAALYTWSLVAHRVLRSRAF